MTPNARPQGGSGMRWQCQLCSSVRVTDIALGMIEGSTEVHRLICEGCGAVNHYDRKAGKPEPTRSLSGTFTRVPGETASPS